VSSAERGWPQCWNLHCAACQDLRGAPHTGVDGEVSRLGGCGDILMALKAGMTVADVSVTHPASSTNLAAAAQTDGAAAERWDEAERWPYNRLEPHGYPFIPFTVESYGRLGKPALCLVARLGLEAAVVGGANLRFPSWLAWARRPQSQKGQASLSLCLGPSGS
jgi:hypothetical protein